jgi:hypothetical protein
VAPPAGPAAFGGWRLIIFAIIVAATVVWVILANQPPPKPAEVRVIRVNATPPPAAPPAAPVTGLFACPYEAYRTRHGVIVCGVLMVTDQYVMIQRGWIWAANATAIRVIGDLSACAVRLGVNTMYLDCAYPVMIMR